jgi:pilus assembly protein CpaE
MSLIILAAADAAFEQRVRSVLPNPFGGGGLQRWDKPLADAADVKALADRAPAAVILGPAMGKDIVFSLAAHFDHYYPTISVLVVAPPGPDTWQRALATGARGVISPDASDDELRSHIAQALETARRRAEAVPPAAAAPPARARVITVISPKGGSGKTIVSTNLAVGLAVQAPGEVVLLDLDLQFGDISYALGVTPQHTIADAVSVLTDLDATTLKVFLTRHRSGLYALCAPDEPAAGEVIPAAAITRVIELIASQFGYVVIDTPGGLTEHTLAALDLSTDVILLSDMDVPSVRNLRKALDALDALGMRSPTRHFVLNRADSRVGLTKSGIAAAAGTTIDLELPSCRQVPLSLNEGRPLLTDNPRSPAARRLAELVERIIEAPGYNGNGNGNGNGGRGGTS